MNQRENEKGFTMVELITVIAVLGIIGAVLVPAYSTITTKARLTVDIATVKTLKRTADTYRIEKGEYPIEANLEEGLKTVNEVLKNAEYLEQVATFKTDGAELKISDKGATYTLNIDSVKEKDVVEKALKQMDEEEVKQWVVGSDLINGK